MDIPAPLVATVPPLSPPAIKVLESLESSANAVTTPSGPDSCGEETFNAPGSIHSLIPLEQIKTHCFSLSPVHGARVHAQTLSIETDVRVRALPGSRTRIRDVLLLATCSRKPARSGAKWLLLNCPAVRVGGPRFARMPHSRWGVDLDALSDQERAGFLREAEQLRSVTPDNGELLAIFRKVPIELVLQIRFIAEKMLLLFTVAQTSGLRRTRVHDLAVVGDKGSGRTHLVAHRTKYQTAFLG